jgi:hypothetical protein
MENKQQDLIQEYLTAWMNWYYGNDPYPTELNNKLTLEQLGEVIEKKEKIKEIVGQIRSSE